MTKDLRLLLDECLQGELADAIKAWKKIKAEWVCEVDSLRQASDREVMAYAQKQRRILVTVETRLNEHDFEICTHHGIVVFRATRRHEAIKAELFKKLMLSGKRKLCHHAVTYLREKEIVFRRLENGRIIDTIIKV